MHVLALIGARAGSKGFPGKNIRPFCGKPLLSHPIRTASQCTLVNRIILSTDSEEYAAIGRQFGAETPFLRPAELARDTSIDFEFVHHAVDWLKANEGYQPDVVVRLYPTTPLVRPADVDRCIEVLMADPSADSAITMTPAHEHPRKSVRLTADGTYVVSYMTERGADVSPSNRQGHVTAFNRQSLPVVSRTETVMKLGSLTGDRVRYHLIPRETALDIDDELDFRLAEWMVDQLQTQR